MPCVPFHVENVRNHSANPTTLPSCSTTWAKTLGSSANRLSRSCSSVAFTSCRARSYSARSRISRRMSGTSCRGRESDHPCRLPAGQGGLMHPPARRGLGTRRFTRARTLVESHARRSLGQGPSGGSFVSSGTILRGSDVTEETAAMPTSTKLSRPRRGDRSAAGRQRLPVRAAHRDGGPGGPPGLHSGRDRGPAHRGRRGLRDAARPSGARHRSGVRVRADRRRHAHLRVGAHRRRPGAQPRHLRLDGADRRSPARWTPGSAPTTGSP